MANKTTAAKKLTYKGGFFDSLDMMKISNVGNLLSQNPSTLTNDLYADARPVFSGISTTVDNNIEGLIGTGNTQNIFLPSYNGGAARPKAKAPKPAPKTKPKAPAAKPKPKPKAPAAKK
jgi:hypothetical protein